MKRAVAEIGVAAFLMIATFLITLRLADLGKIHWVSF
jgi:hypothetical protein